MRHFGTAFTLALVSLTAGTASAQQQQQISIQFMGGSVTPDNGKGGLVISAGGGVAGQAAVALAGLTLTKAQQDSVAKLNAAREAAAAAADARFVEAARAVLTDAQRAQFDKSVAEQKKNDEAMRKTLAGFGMRSRADEEEELKKLDDPDDDDAGDGGRSGKKK